MNITTTRTFRIAVAVAALTIANHSAQALTFLVGASPAPSICNFNDLQDAIDAAQSNPGEDFIRIAGDQDYTALALTIGQQDLTITGCYASCTAATPVDATPTGTTVLSGAGGAAAPVFSISGSGVRVLTSMQIRNGDNVQGNGSGCGGGIRFSGRGELRLVNLGIAQNEANHGGGVCFSGTATPSALTVDGDVAINNNEATSGNGGGIFVAGSARLYVLRDRTLIAFNQAPNGDGGGIYMQAPARADIGSPGFGSNGVLYANIARRGGGVAGYAPEDSGDGNTCLRFFTTDATRPVRLQGNKASAAGGAIYVRSDAGGLESFYTIEARAYDFRIDGNTAPNGPAVFLDGDETAVFGFERGSRLVLNDFSNFFNDCNEPLNAIGRVPCTNQTECNRIDNNRAEDLNGQPANGNVIEIQDASTVDGQQLTMNNNRGTRLFSWSGGGAANLFLRHCAFVDNTTTQELFRGFNDGAFRIQDCTIAGNAIGNTHVLRFDDGETSTQIDRTLIDQPGKLTIAHSNLSGPYNSHEWVLATETETLRDDPTNQTLQGSGRFVDAERGDYRLVVGSQAVDYAPTPVPALNEDVDLDGRARNVDLDDASANPRARDVGGYERIASDPWLRNGHFTADLRHWSNAAPVHASWDASGNAPGSSGGSLLYSVPADQVGPMERRTVLTQCFNVPSSGDYSITGKALVAVPTGNRDYPIVHWVVRYDSENCTGSEAASGDGFFGRSGSTWQSLTAPLIVPIDPARWTWNTTIEIRLEAAQNQTSTSATSLFARFDDIEISKRLPLMFRDGFE